MATPLHSQNFVDTGHGILTNNRRLVTKTMWFNGTALSAQARRALENERVTVVAHETGWIHILFPEATIDPEAFGHFSGKLRKFLQSPLTPELLGNFVRHSGDLQKCFQVRWRNFGVDNYIEMEKLLAYERDFPYRFNDDTRERLFMEVAGEDFVRRPAPEPHRHRRSGADGEAAAGGHPDAQGLRPAGRHSRPVLPQRPERHRAPALLHLDRAPPARPGRPRPSPATRPRWASRSGMERETDHRPPGVHPRRRTSWPTWPSTPTAT